MLLLGFRGLLFISSFASGWTGSLRVSDDSSMYARFSPKKSSNWQLGEEAKLRGGEGKRIGWQEEGIKGLREGWWSKSVVVTCLQLLFDTQLYSFDGTSSFFTCAVLMSRAPPSSMLQTV